MSYITSEEKDELEKFVLELGKIAYRVSKAREQLVIAGVGSFNTQKEYKFLCKLEAKLEKMQVKLKKHLG